MNLLILPMFLIGLIIFCIAVLVFWLYQFIDMLQSKKLKKTEKGLWALGFIFFGFVTSIIWFIVKR